MALLLALLLGGCAAAPQLQCAPEQHTALLDQLYFGTGRAHGAPVGVRDWDGFVRQEIAPRLPQGFTVLDAQGQWRAADGGVVRERSHLLQVVHPDDGSADAPLAQIIARYKAQFEQESVLQVRSAVCLGF